MKFKKKEKETKPNKVKKVLVMKVGTHKKTVIALWLVLIASVSFGVYKNFTAIGLKLSSRILLNPTTHGITTKILSKQEPPPSATILQRHYRI